MHHENRPQGTWCNMHQIEDKKTERTQMSEKCKKRIPIDSWGRTKQCSFNAVKDGFCNKHHPDSVKARREASIKRWEDKYNNTPFIKLSKEVEAWRTRFPQHEYCAVDNLVSWKLTTKEDDDEN